MNWILLQIAAFLGATLLSALLTRAFRSLAPRWGLWDKPQSEHHKNHTKPTAVVGGCAMVSTWVLLLAVGVLVAFFGKSALPAPIQEVLAGLPVAARSLAVVAVGATVLALMGLCDDRRAMHAGRKLLLQLAVSFLTALLGPRVLVGIVPDALSVAFTTLWIATVINAMNFFDNMDGLTGGVSLIAFAFLSAIGAIRGQCFVVLFTALAAGCAAGFLFYNYPRASVFMGDCGSHFLGYLLAVSCILTTFYHPADTPSALALAIPFIVLSVPLLDAAVVVVIRLRLHKPIYVGDNRHLSHRFVQIGLSRPLAVAAIWLLAFLAGAGALTLIWLPPAGALIILAQIVAMLALVLLIQLGARSS